jgi:hypothetical protein
MKKAFFNTLALGATSASLVGCSNGTTYENPNVPITAQEASIPSITYEGHEYTARRFLVPAKFAIDTSCGATWRGNKRIEVDETITAKDSDTSFVTCYYDPEKFTGKDIAVMKKLSATVFLNY